MASTLERLALTALVGAVPVGMVDAALDATGVVAGRVRTLPPWVTTYHVLAAAMCPSAGYDGITELLWTTLPAATGRGLSRRRPTPGAITRARSRLGAEPLAQLLRQSLDAVSPDLENTPVHLYRFRSPGTPGLWWMTDGATGALRGCEVGGADPDAAVALLRGAGVAHVTADLPAPESAYLSRRLGPGIEFAGRPLPAVDDTPWRGLRARTRPGWEQDALARACVAVAQELAWASARRAHP